MPTPNGHLYATRAATLEYQRYSGGGFEEARRELTTRLLTLVDIEHFRHAGARASYTLTIPLSAAEPPDSDALPRIVLRARVQREGPLLVVSQLTRTPENAL